MPADRDSLGSRSNKGGRKDAALKRPGPAPAQPAPKVSAPAKKRAKTERVNNKNQRTREDKLLFGDPKSTDPDKKAGLHKTVINSRGRTRGFFENCVFLTLFCSLYKEAAAENDQLCVSHRLAAAVLVLGGCSSRICWLC